MSALSSFIFPIVSPAHNAAIAIPEYLLDLKMGIRRLTEEVLPKLGDRVVTRVSRAIGRWVRKFVDTIVARELHHVPDVVTVKGIVELEDDPDSGFYAGHSGWTHLLHTYLGKKTPGAECSFTEIQVCIFRWEIRRKRHALPSKIGVVG
jgi:hypothetical protein